MTSETSKKLDIDFTTIFEDDKNDAQLIIGKINNNKLMEKTKKHLNKKIISNLNKRPIIKLWGKECNQNRDISFFSDFLKGYEYSGTIETSKPLTKTLGKILNIINNTFNATYNGILINHYNDGSCNIGEHSDAESGLDKNGNGVLAIHYGVKRKFVVKRKSDGKRYEIFPGDNEIIWMKGNDFQKLYTHQLPKVSTNKVNTSKTSLTFRSHNK